MKKKSTTEGYWLWDELERVKERRGEYIRSRFYVVEVTPSQRYDQGNGHGGYESAWTKQRIVMVSDYFDTKEEAEDFLNKHEPDEGKTLETREEGLYRRTVEEWF